MGALSRFAGGELVELAAHKVTAKGDHEFQEPRLSFRIAELLEDVGHIERIPAVISRPSHSARDPRDVEVKPYHPEPGVGFFGDVAAAVVVGGQLQVDTRRLPIGSLIFDAEVGQRDLAVDHREAIGGGDLSLPLNVLERC